MSESNHVGGAPAPNGSSADPLTIETTSASLPEISSVLRRKVIQFLEEDHMDDKMLRNLQGHVRVAMDVVGEALQRYGFEKLSLSYNGGKDCLVLLILILACLPEVAHTNGKSVFHAGSEDETPSKRLQALYIVSKDPFPEVEEFVATSTAQYHLDLVRCALPMREALDTYLKKKTSVLAIFMGTRRTDPHSDTLGHFSPTDKGWPQFMRINPVIDWHYADIWAFIRHFEIPYCCLYDQGFTSLGGVSDTRPNPALALDAESGRYRPAYELTRDDEERKGRE